MYNNICLAVRGNNVEARYAIGGRKPGFFTETAGTPKAHVVSSAQPGMIGTDYIDTYNAGATNRCGLIYNSLNLWDGRPFSFLFRAARKRNADMGMFGCGTGTGEGQGAVQIFRSTNTNVYCSSIRNDAGAEVRDQQPLSTDMTSDVFHDFVVTCSGNTADGGTAINSYLDGVLQQSYSCETNMETTKDKNLAQIHLGFCLNLVVGGWWIEEFVVWNTVIDPTNVILTSGSGSLTGPTRTAFVDCPVFDGADLTSTDPGESNTISGTSYSINGVSKTGTYVPVVDTDVRLGVAFGNSETGVYQAEVTAQDIADAVWGAELTDYTTDGTFGTQIKKLLTLGKFIGLK